MIASKLYEIGYQLLLITNRKSHTVYRLVTLNDLERRNSPYFALFHRIRWLCRPITSQWLKIDLCCLQNTIFHFWPKMTHPAARFLCNSWATCPLLIFTAGGHMCLTRLNQSHYRGCKCQIFTTAVWGVKLQTRHAVPPALITDESHVDEHRRWFVGALGRPLHCPKSGLFAPTH